MSARSMLDRRTMRVSKYEYLGNEPPNSAKLFSKGVSARSIAHARQCLEQRFETVSTKQTVVPYMYILCVFRVLRCQNARTGQVSAPSHTLGPRQMPKCLSSYSIGDETAC